MTKPIKKSVRELVEFLLRRGHIDNRYTDSPTALEGIRAHQRIQKGYGEDDKAEVSLSTQIEIDDVTLRIEGRADGVLKSEHGYTIDEIKTTRKDLDLLSEDSNPLHWAQALCYGYMFCKENNLERMDIRLTYCNVEAMSARHFVRTYSFEALKTFFHDLIHQYEKWVLWQQNWLQQRANSLKALQFPFPNYRPGQRELAVGVYKSIMDGKNCYAQAPTGIGKTMSTLFPSLKAMGEGHTSKIFYFTAKTITRDVAEQALLTLDQQQLKGKRVTLTAKEKVCKMAEVNCNPEYCPYAKGHWDRVNDAIYDALNTEHHFDRVKIDELSEKHQVCPFEFALDLTLFSDIVICDYNYLFDPKVYLKRFFETSKSDYTFLIDEAHNLVERGRNMYSTSLNEQHFQQLQKELDVCYSDVRSSCEKIAHYFHTSKQQLNGNHFSASKELPTKLLPLLERFLTVCDENVQSNKGDIEHLLQVYFDVHSFLSISAYFDDHYRTVVEERENDLHITLQCVDPTKLLQKRMKIGRANIIFSATLLPLHYFARSYGATKDDYILSLQSPFKAENRLLMIGKDVATTFHRRNESVDKIVSYVLAVTQAKIGNYMIFFPSYAYMEMVYEKLRTKRGNLIVTMQERQMTEERKEEYLAQFQEATTVSQIGFCVLGSHFSEGIDLVAERLIGVIVVGVGMPQINPHRDLIKEHADEQREDGFKHAYVYPGMMKVLQAVGRCIRTETDQGVILLLDSRYGKQEYEQLFPQEWYPHYSVYHPNDATKLASEFWEQ